MAVSIKLQITNNRTIQIGKAILPSHGGDTTTYIFNDQLRMGNIGMFVDNCEVYMLGMYSPDFDVYIMHFQVCVLDENHYQTDVLQFVACTNDFNYDSTEWVMQPSTHDNPTQEFCELIKEF